MIYFVTGASGVIGQHIVRNLLSQGAEVRALKRGNSDLSYLADVKEQIEWVEGDILDVTALGEAIAGVDYVVHAAAVVYFGSSKLRRKMAKVNIEGTQNVVNICLDTPSVKKICYISSIASIGRGANDQWVTEKNKWEDSESHSFYGYTKYQGELEVWRGIAEGQEAVIINPSLVLGTGNWENSSLQLFKYAWQAKRMMPLGTLNYVDARDVAKAVWQLTQSDIINERFILSGGQLLYKDFFANLHQRFGKEVQTIDLKPWMATIGWRVSQVMSLIGMKPLITKETMASSASHTKFDGSKISRLTGFEYHSLSETLDWTCNYFKEQA